VTRATSSPQHLVDHALETSASPECVVIVQDETHANLRWANNTLTTNGVGHDVGVTVIAFRDGATASVSSTAASTERVTALVEAADAATTWSAATPPPTGTTHRRRPRSRSTGRSRRRSGRSSSGQRPSSVSSTAS
jgi:predicted Zn-dependent protease